MVNESYFNEYKIGDRVDLCGKIIEIFDFRGSYTGKRGFVINARFEDISGNDWIVPMQIDLYGLGHKADYDEYVGKLVAISGYYEGFSNLYQMPCFTMYDAKDDQANSVIYGIRKSEELAKDEQTIYAKEPITIDVGFKLVLTDINRWLKIIRRDMIKNGFNLTI